MAMKRCPICGERYSDTYKECPFCEEEEYWEEEQPDDGRRPILREGARSASRGGRSAYGIVTPILIVLIVLMALLLVYLLYGDKLFGKDKDKGPEDNAPGITQPQEPGITPGTTPAVEPAGTDEPDSSGEPSGADTPDASGDGSMPEGNGGTGTSSGDGGTSSGGMSYATAAALPGGLTLSSTDFTQPVSRGAVKLRVSGGTGTYTWISENPSIATVASDGSVTPVASGTTNVVVTDGSKKAICIVRVTGGSAPSSGGGGTTTTTPPSTGTSSGGTTSGGTTSGGTTSGGTTSGGSLKAGKATVINGGNGVRVRSGPGTNYDILATVPNGGSVQVVRAAGTGDWYEITFSNVGGVTTTGYMKGEFLANS